ncbi:MAG: DNA polymerase IV [Candidatus Sungbacteria bacterium]|nr:DNA polymerase IV [Candidatus Sungbacteria bacterium]
MRIIFHVDMDAFFAAVEECEKSWLKGKPIVVGADPKNGKGRGVVSTASYKAREYGIHSAMPISQAWRLAEKAIGEGKPKTVFLGASWKEYSETSERIMEILRGYGEKIEQASVDEAYLEIKIRNPKFEIRNNSWEYAKRLAERIKKEILRKEKLTCSVGVGPNKLIAKMASSIEKPDGLTVVRPDEVQAFLDSQTVDAIPGIGPKSGIFLKSRRIKTIADLRKTPKRKLVEWFGKWGGDMYEKARGIDDDPVAEDRAAKSIGEQETFEKDTFDSRILIRALQKLARSVFANAKDQNFLFKTVSITVRFIDFETKTRAHTLKTTVRDYKAFEREALKLFLPFLDRRENPKKKLIRLIGVRAEHVQRQGELF